MEEKKILDEKADVESELRTLKAKKAEEDSRREWCEVVASTIMIAAYFSVIVFGINALLIIFFCFDFLDFLMCLTPLTKWLANHTLGVWITIGVIFVLLITVLIATGLINPYYVLLLPIPIGISLVYSLAKRYTWICHILLAMTNASVPVASWIVFYDWKDWRGMILGASVFFWTLGFELIYSSQDVFYDIQMGMKSIPVVFGIKKTYQISIFCHVIMSVLLVLFSYIMNVGVIFWIGLFAGIMLIVKEHILISGNRVENAKYTFDLNQMFSCILMIFSMLDFLLQYSRETGL